MYSPLLNLVADRLLNCVHISSPIGEPPLMLAVSVWAAVKQALASAAPGRRPGVDLPATNEEILRRLTERRETFDDGPPGPADAGANGPTNGPVRSDKYTPERA